MTNERMINVSLAPSSRPTLKRASEATLDQRLAVLLDGRVTEAPIVQGVMDETALQITGSKAEISDVGRRLSATEETPSDSGGGFPIPSPGYLAALRKACAAVPRTLVHGLLPNTMIMELRTMTPTEAARLSREVGDESAAAMWDGQPADDAVYLCHFASSTTLQIPSPQNMPSCPPGQDPVINNRGAVSRDVLTDGRGHSSVLPQVRPQPDETCAPG